MGNFVDAMPQRLHIALQDGFEDDLVVLIVNGKEVYRKKGVQTDYRISLADSFEMALPDTPVVIEVQLPDRHLTQIIKLDENSVTHVGISCLENDLQFWLSDKPFGYL